MKTMYSSKPLWILLIFLLWLFWSQTVPILPDQNFLIHLGKNVPNALVSQMCLGNIGTRQINLVQFKIFMNIADFSCMTFLGKLSRYPQYIYYFSSKIRLLFDHWKVANLATCYCPEFSMLFQKQNIGEKWDILLFIVFWQVLRNRVTEFSLFSFLSFPALGLNSEIYKERFCIWSKYGRYGAHKTPISDFIHAMLLNMNVLKFSLKCKTRYIAFNAQPQIQQQRLTDFQNIEYIHLNFDYFVSFDFWWCLYWLQLLNSFYD